MHNLTAMFLIIPACAKKRVIPVLCSCALATALFLPAMPATGAQNQAQVQQNAGSPASAASTASAAPSTALGGETESPHRAEDLANPVAQSIRPNGVYLYSIPTPEPGLFGTVTQKAIALSQKSYADTETNVPDFLLSLSMEEWRQIRFNEENTLWKGLALPFEAQFYHPGSIFNRTVAINVVEGEEITELPFSMDLFSYPDDFPLERLSSSRTGFAGFRLAFSHPVYNEKRDIALFLGASHFQSAGKNAMRSITARGIALNTAVPSGEEFPYFREFWLVRPKADDNSITFYALLDSPSLTGAYRFTLAQGASSVMDVDSRLFIRQGAGLPQKIGLAAMNSMFHYSESSMRPADDFRPEVHGSDGLLYRNGEHEWVWRTLSNPQRLSVQSIGLRNPRGFGLLQRDDNFEHYADINTRYDRASSLWVEPSANWGDGLLELVEIPTRTEIHSNIHAFWIPAAPAAQAQGESAPTARGLAFGYRMYWMDPGVTPHALGRAVSTRIAHTAQDSLTFVIDFEGETLKGISAETGLSSVVETPEQVHLMEKQLAKNPATGGWRLTLKVKRPPQEGVVQSILAARDGVPRLKFRAFLKKGENLPDPLTEVWVYDLP